MKKAISVSYSDFLSVKCEVANVFVIINSTVHPSLIYGDERSLIACKSTYHNADKKTCTKVGYPIAYQRSANRTRQHSDFFIIINDKIANNPFELG